MWFTKFWCKEHRNIVYLQFFYIASLKTEIFIMQREKSFWPCHGSLYPGLWGNRPPPPRKVRHLFSAVYLHLVSHRHWNSSEATVIATDTESYGKNFRRHCMCPCVHGTLYENNLHVSSRYSGWETDGLRFDCRQNKCFTLSCRPWFPSNLLANWLGVLSQGVDSLKCQHYD
jgi:hypothetical protein